MTDYQWRSGEVRQHNFVDSGLFSGQYLQAYTLYTPAGLTAYLSASSVTSVSVMYSATGAPVQDSAYRISAGLVITGGAFLTARRLEPYANIYLG